MIRQGLPKLPSISVRTHTNLDSGALFKFPGDEGDNLDNTSSRNLCRHIHNSLILTLFSHSFQKQKPILMSIWRCRFKDSINANLPVKFQKSYDAVLWRGRIC